MRTLFAPLHTLLRPPSHWLAIAALGMLLGLACDSADGKQAPGTDTGPGDVDMTPRITTVRTTLDTLTIDAGGAVTVACQGYDQFDDAFDVNTTFEVSDAGGQLDPDGVTVTGNVVSVTRAGGYRFRCVFGGPPRIADLAAADLTVLAGPAVSVSTSLFLTNLEAGATVSVRCTVKDANGNAAVAETVARTTPEDGAIVAGRTIQFIGAGEYQVLCATVSDIPLVAEDPVDVSVSPGRLKLLRTVLVPTTITPGEAVQVSCPGEDSYGNAVNLEKVFTFPKDGIDFLDDTRLRLTATRSGTYEVACVPKEVAVTAASIPASFTVNPGDPSLITLDISPERAIYSLGAKATLTPRLTDAWDNPIPGVGDTLTTECRNGGVIKQTVESGQKVTLDAEGTWRLTTRSGPPWNISASLTVLVDDSAPSIDITYPERGAMIASGGGQLGVIGRITDATGGLSEVKINGAAQPITAGTNIYVIDYDLFAKHGLNTLVVEATDMSDNTTRVAQSFLNASGYTAPTARTSQGIIVHLGKDFIDDGDRTGAPNDLATIFDQVVNGIDIAGFIPSPAVTYGGYDVFLKNLSYDRPTLSLSPGSGQLDVTMQIRNLRVDIDADGFIDVSGTVTTDTIDIRMQLALSVVNGVPKATEVSTAVDVGGLDINVHWSINWLINLFTNTIRDSLTNSFRDILRQQLPPLLGDALGALELDQTFAVPAFLPGMEPINLSLDTRPEAIDSNVDGLDLDLATRVTTVKRVPWSAPGALQRGGCFGAANGLPTWKADRRIGFALSMDVLNQLLFDVWWGGGLELTLDQATLGDLSEYGVTNFDATMSGRLPPVLTDCVDERLLVQIGELQADMQLTLAGIDLDMTLVIAFETEATLEISDEDELSLSIGDIDANAVIIDITRVDSQFFGVDQEEALLALLREQVLSNLLSSFGGNSLAGFALPEIDLGLIADDLAGQTISIKNVELDTDRGFVVLQGDP